MKNVFVCVRDIFFLSCCIYNCNHLNLFSIIKLFTNKMQPTMCSKFMSTTVLIIYNHNNTKNNGNTNESNKNKVGINMKHLIH